MKIGVVGNGMIVGMFLQDSALVDKADIVALCVRQKSLEKGKKIAETYQISRVDTDYEAFLKNPEIETVYVGISNLVHYEYVKKALEAGKHVICEKPFTVTGKEAKELSSLARERGLFLWEAFIIPYLPPYTILRDYLSKTGNVKLVQCNYSKISSRYASYLNGEILPAFDLSLAGGALYDLNIYNLHFTVGLFGKPKAAHYYPVKGYNGVDTSGIAVLEYDNFQAVCCAAKDSTSPSGFFIQGDAGTLQGKESVSTLAKITFADQSGETVISEFDGNNKLSYELAEFIRQFEAKDLASCYEMLTHSVEVAQVVDELRA